MKVYYFQLLLNMCCIAIVVKTFFDTFWRLKTLVLWRKIVQNVRIYVCLFCPKNSAIDFRKTFITREWLVVEKSKRNIVRLNLEQNIKSLLYNYLVYVCAQDVWQFYEKSARLRTHFDTVHNWVIIESIWHILTLIYIW